MKVRPVVDGDDAFGLVESGEDADVVVVEDRSAELGKERNG